MSAPRARRAAGAVWACALLLAGLVAPGASASRDETLWVNTAEDLVDGDTRSLDALNLDPGPDGRVSLREAMLTAMNDIYPGQRVRIEILSSLVPLVTVTTELPRITRDGLELDGNGARLDGANCPECNGIIIEGGNNIVENLIIGSFPKVGVLIEGPRANENVVGKCQIGIWNDVPLPNISGIDLSHGASRNSIVGNVISSNRFIGVAITDGANHNALTRNLIGITADGTRALPNGYNMGFHASSSSSGIHISRSSGTRIGSPPDGGNVISSYHGSAISVGDSASFDTRIQSNSIVKHDVILAILPDMNHGGYISISRGASDVLLGGDGPGEGNLLQPYINTVAILVGSRGSPPEIPCRNIQIIGNRINPGTQTVNAESVMAMLIGPRSSGILIRSNEIYGFRSGVVFDYGAERAIVTRNSIYGNFQDGILHRYYPDGPPLTVSISESAPYVGTTAPCAKVEMFLDEGGQGREYIGAVYADGDGHFELLAPEDADPGLNVTAVALDPLGNTSAFSAPVPVALVARGALPEAPALGPCERRYHPTVDQNQDGVISVDELLRVLQLYNSGGYSCAPGTEDGYAPGPGPQDCLPHSADYLIQDWNIDLDELLRTLQLYNSGGYHPCEGSEDGFCGAD